MILEKDGVHDGQLSMEVNDLMQSLEHPERVDADRALLILSLIHIFSAEIQIRTVRLCSPINDTNGKRRKFLTEKVIEIQKRHIPI